ncbi:carboxypeptidase [Solibacillus sp. FSL H8-0538]|uniref:carboxypeptidase n=1 Tax=Solibacillus sp. FSL H8-0538 TaxID=2921400 RepID=UPI0030F82CE7
MKKYLLITLLFIVSYAVVHWIGELFFSTDTTTAMQGRSMLQSAVTFGGINFLSIFVYILIAIAITAIVYFSVKSRRSN